MTEFDKMIRLLDMAWSLRSEIVPCLVGPPGIGKTAAVEQHAFMHGCGKVVKIVASRCIPSETVGMTMPDHKHRSMEIYNSMQLSSLEDGDILFLDELLEADQYVLSTLLTVIESREMADGTPLPDIQIIAATNDTIPPEQLKGNIRQRFMFQRFIVDQKQTADYIKRKTGMDMPISVMKMLTDSGRDYNFLTPRSLTKLALWVDSTPDDKLDNIAAVIDNMWNNSLGTMLVEAKKNKAIPSPEEQVRKAVLDMVEQGFIPEITAEHFKDCTIDELYETLTSLDAWEDIAKKLSELEIEEPKEVMSTVLF